VQLRTSLVGRVQAQVEEQRSASPAWRKHGTPGRASGDAERVIEAVLARSPGAHAYTASPEARKLAAARCKRGPLSSEDLDGWHADLSSRLDAAMSRLSPALHSPDP
jgi:hypothetical protein